MLQTMWATIQGGQIRLCEPVDLPEGAKLLVTLLPTDENRYWLEVSQKCLSDVWDNAEDDAYAQLLEK